jgi:hypothetical protein
MKANPRLRAKEANGPPFDCSGKARTSTCSAASREHLKAATPKTPITTIPRTMGIILRYWRGWTTFENADAYERIVSTRRHLPPLRSHLGTTSKGSTLRDERFRRRSATRSRASRSTRSSVRERRRGADEAAFSDGSQSYWVDEPPTGVRQRPSGARGQLRELTDDPHISQ